MSQASAFGEFKKKANADLAEIFKQYTPPWEVTAPAYLDKYLRGLLVPDDEGNIRRISREQCAAGQRQRPGDVGLSKVPFSHNAITKRQNLLKALFFSLFTVYWHVFDFSKRF